MIIRNSATSIPLPGSPRLSILITSGVTPPRFIRSRDRDLMTLFLYTVEQEAKVLARLGPEATLFAHEEWAAPGGFIMDLTWDENSHVKFHHNEAM